MPLTLRTMLDLDVLATGRPEIVAGDDLVDRPVRWVHVTEPTTSTTSWVATRSCSRPACRSPAPRPIRAVHPAARQRQRAG
ncbi:hypothetical protein [Aeromicrobium sp. UC242_57]|uniref:hypothetical protein n=1 Tax=Aeromicrobium sp. UC242_57 TaxID=3374624 RepID=UPI0037B7E49F